MHLHHYIDQVCAGPGAKPAPCGEKQVYRPPTGQRAEYADVLVSRGDLRDLLAYYRNQDYVPDIDLCERLEALLD